MILIYPCDLHPVGECPCPEHPCSECKPTRILEDEDLNHPERLLAEEGE